MTVRKGLGQANILRTNNNTSTGYGIVYADEVSGHRTVANLTALYALNDWQLSASGDNTDNDAIGQLWYVVNADGNGNGCYYQLKDWSKRNETAGWSIADYTTKAELSGAVANINTAIAKKANAQDVTNAIGELQDSIKNIAITGGASTAAAVTFDNTASGMIAVNAQGAIEELNVKKLAKADIVQELGESEDKVVSQKCVKLLSDGIDTKFRDFSKKVGYINGQYPSNTVIFNKDEIGAGTKISIKVVPLYTMFNIITKNNSDEIINRFQRTDAVVGQEYILDEYILPENYETLMVGSYGNVLLNITINGYDLKSLRNDINTQKQTEDDLSQQVLNITSDINRINESIYFEEITISEAIIPTIKEGYMLLVEGKEQASSIINIASFNLTAKQYSKISIIANVSRNDIIGYIFYDSNNKVLLADTGAALGGTKVVHELNIPEKAATLKFSYYKSDGISATVSYTDNIDVKDKINSVNEEISKLQDNINNIDVTKDSEQAKTLIGKNAASVSATNLSDSELTLTEFPRYVKKEFVISAEAKIASFNEIAIGIGYKSIRGLYLKIDNTNVNIVIYLNNEERVLVTHPHKLTLDKFIKVYIDFYGDAIKYVINTLGGSYYTDDTELGKKVYGSTSNISLYDIYGYAFIWCDSTTSLTNINLNRCDRGLRNMVWIFGDSICSTDNVERWGYYMLNKYHIKNFYLVALAGQTSNDLNNHVGAFSDLTKALKYGTPKYLWWEIMTNDNNDVYRTYLDKVIELCEKYKITLIAVKHPKMGEQSSNRNWKEKNNYMESKNVRFVDWYKALTLDSANDEIYPNYQSSDGVHPTVLGAQAQATQILVDFPEIARY